MYKVENCRDVPLAGLILKLLSSQRGMSIAYLASQSAVVTFDGVVSGVGMLLGKAIVCRTDRRSPVNRCECCARARPAVAAHLHEHKLVPSNAGINDIYIRIHVIYNKERPLTVLKTVIASLTRPEASSSRQRSNCHIPRYPEPLSSRNLARTPRP